MMRCGEIGLTGFKFFFLFNCQWNYVKYRSVKLCENPWQCSITQIHFCPSVSLTGLDYVTWQLNGIKRGDPELKFSHKRGAFDGMDSDYEPSTPKKTAYSSGFGCGCGPRSSSISISSGDDNMKSMSPEMPPPLFYRHRRKGIPHRAPFWYPKSSSKYTVKMV